MYRYKKNNNQKLKNTGLIFVVIVFTAICSIFCYKIYEGIEINTYETQGEEVEKTIKSVEEKKKQGTEIADINRKCYYISSWNFKNKKYRWNNISKRWNVRIRTWNRNNSIRKWIYIIKRTCNRR